MLSALALVVLALDSWFAGMLVERRGLLPGLLAVAAAPVIFTIGRGIVIDGVSRRIICWRGWVHKPLMHRSHDFSVFNNVEVAKKLGPRGGGNTGRSVKRPLYLNGKDGRRILLMTCTWVDGARALASEVAQLMSVTMHDLFPADEDLDG
jgi:hypothetical protein